MRRYRISRLHIGLGLLTCFAAPAVVSAQLCIASPPLSSDADGSLGARVAFQDGDKEYALDGTVGSDFFATGSIAYTDYGETSASLKIISVSGGYEIKVATGAVSVCPRLAVAYGFGLESGGLDVSTRSIAPTLSAGVDTGEPGEPSVLFFVEASLVRLRLLVETGTPRAASRSETKAWVRAGAALRLQNDITVGPTLQLRTDGAVMRLGLGIAVPVGS